MTYRVQTIRQFCENLVNLFVLNNKTCEFVTGVISCPSALDKLVPYLYFVLLKYGIDFCLFR